MADWTANSDFGALGRREPVVRASRDAAPRTQGIKAERFAPIPSFDEEEAEELPTRPASAALAEYNAAQDGPLAKARVAVWAGGGIVSLALIAGIGVWGYKLVLREVMGLPVVVAEDGPMRVLPADPEGEVVPQQGLAVNAIPAAGTAAPPSDVLMLAPQAPGLAEEDMEVVQTEAEAGEVTPAALAAPAAPVAVATDALAPVAAAPLDAVPAQPAAAPAAPAEAAAAAPSAPAPDAAATVAQLASALLPTDRPMTTEEILAFADQIARQSAPLAAPVATPATAAPAAVAPAPAPVATVQIAPAPAEPAPAADAAALVPATVAGLVTALRPPTRPAAQPAPAAEAAPAVAAQPAPAEAAPAEAVPATASAVTLTASLPAGTQLVQLGAFDSPEIAASEWQRLQGRFGEFLGAKERVVQETQSGGRTLYRLRALGFADRADARRLCAALTAEGADCIPVTVD